MVKSKNKISPRNVKLFKKTDKNDTVFDDFLQNFDDFCGNFNDKYTTTEKIKKYKKIYIADYGTKRKNEKIGEYEHIGKNKNDSDNALF